MIHTAAAPQQGCDQGTQLLYTQVTDQMRISSCEGLHSCPVVSLNEGHLPGNAADTNGLLLYMHCCTSEDCMSGCVVKLVLQQSHQMSYTVSVPAFHLVTKQSILLASACSLSGTDNQR